MKKLTRPFYLSILTSSILTAILFVAGRFYEIRSVSFLLLFFLISSTVLFSIFRYFLFDRLNKIVKRIEPSFIGEPDFVHQLDLTLDKWSRERTSEIERLKKLENYRKEFLGNVGHELKTPIFNIQGYIMTLLEGGLEDERINRKYLQRAEKSVERMVSMLEDLEAITQLESGELELEPEKFELADLVSEVLIGQEFRAQRKNIILTFKHYHGRPLLVYADKSRMRQVLTNLIVNSIKYGKEEGETIVRVNDIGYKFRVEIADNGVGIPEEHLPRLFERFYRVDKSRSREMGGTGLGLAIVKHILEAHGQTITAMSTPGAGSVFSFTIEKADSES